MRRHRRTPPLRSSFCPHYCGPSGSEQTLQRTADDRPTPGRAPRVPERRRCARVRPGPTSDRARRAHGTP
ncbi:hypothetical protein ACFPRL_34975 [Pseudoclavibacter helvolus]